MALVITPEVSKWLYQTESFTIVFRAYDDNGERCRNDQLSLEYNITYDGTMPDLNDLKTINGDASGLITLVITKPCVISVFGTYVHDVNDVSKGKVIQELAINYEISFQPVVVDITASYIGADIPITDPFNENDLIIRAKLINNTYKDIHPSECIIEDYIIRDLGPNIKTIKYYDKTTSTMWHLDVTINGIPKLIKLLAEYIGERKKIGDTISKTEVNVYGMFLISTSEAEELIVNQDDWYFIDLPVITEANNGIFRLTYRKTDISISVPYDDDISFRLNVWYEGDKIEVGKTYSVHDVVIYLITPDKKRKRLRWDQVHFDSTLVTKIGINIYTVTYMVEYVKITQYFTVEGYENKFTNLAFQVFYVIDKTSDKTENQLNVTKEFEEELIFEDILYVTWERFLKVVNEKERYGLYIVSIPRLSGMSTKYDMDWEVLCLTKTTLKAKIKKIYLKEDDVNG